MSSANAIQVGGDHYKTSAGDLEHWDWAIINDMDPLSYAASKYIVRWDKKGGVKDLRKAHHYISKARELFIARLLVPRGVHRIPLSMFSRVAALTPVQEELCDILVAWRYTGDLDNALGLLDAWLASLPPAAQATPTPPAPTASPTGSPVSLPVGLAAEVAATGWVNYTFEGCVGVERSMYRCKHCAALFTMPTDSAPPLHHSCGAAGSGYVNQDR